MKNKAILRAVLRDCTDSIMPAPKVLMPKPDDEDRFVFVHRVNVELLDNVESELTRYFDHCEIIMKTEGTSQGVPAMEASVVLDNGLILDISSCTHGNIFSILFYMGDNGHDLLATINRKFITIQDNIILL